MTTVEFKSPRDGSVLTFTVTNRTDDDEIEFDVAVKTFCFSGIAPASTYFNGSPSRMFQSMAADWRGWKNCKTWEDIDKQVSFSARSDSIGHVFLSIELTGRNFDNQLRVVMEFEAGQLDHMANEIFRLLG